MHLKHRKTNTKNLPQLKTNIKLQNPGLVAFYNIRPVNGGAYSYNIGARAEQLKRKCVILSDIVDMYHYVDVLKDNPFLVIIYANHNTIPAYK